VFIIGRVLCGFSAGVNEVLIMLYIKEMSPDAICKKTDGNNSYPMSTISTLAEMSGKTGIFIQLFITIGAIATSVFGLKMNSQDANRTLLLFMMGFPIITCVLRSVMLLAFVNYETPKYYVIEKQLDKAKLVLTGIYKEEYVEE